jgi:DegV family protein with EDD domain
MLKIVTDGAADMPAGWEQEYDIQVVPINIHFGEHTYLQNVDLDNEGFYRIVDETGQIPKTSQPTPHQFRQFYERIAQVGDTILSMHVTGKLSGTFDSAVSAARELAGKLNVIPFDSASGSAALGMMCREARLLDRAGTSLEKILDRMEFIRKNVDITFSLNTLEYARLSGRVKTLQAALASLLNVKPIAVLHDGMLQMAEKVRTRTASLERMLEMVKEKFGEQPLNMAVVHARDPQGGQSLLEQVRRKFNVQDLILTDLSISVAANLGPGTIGLITYPAESN